MMLPYSVWDVFTETPFTGNPLTIVEDADELSTAQMQTIAREFNLSETIFVMAPRDPAHTARVRIFFPTAEIPFAGHPTIGCALHLSGKRGLDHVILEEEAGIVPVTLQDGLAELTAPVPPFASPHAPDPDLLARALGLAPADLGPHCPGTHEGGPRFAYAPLRSLEALARAKPMEPHWSQLMEACAVDSVYLYHQDGPQIRARLYSPTAGIPEDPATGSATAILASQLRANSALPEGTSKWDVTQGVEMGRPSQLRLTITQAQGALGPVRIAGRAVPVAQGQINVPR
ncbi:MAG: phenazine biosynthesis protein [Rhodobacterales bacterium]|nr:MAG: phenazine biosynthesis protein [Rhodobacterales bacterium]